MVEKKTSRHSPEFRERAVRLLDEHHSDYPSRSDSTFKWLHFRGARHLMIKAIVEELAPDRIARNSIGHN